MAFTGIGILAGILFGGAFLGILLIIAILCRVVRNVLQKRQGVRKMPRNRRGSVLWLLAFAAAVCGYHAASYPAIMRGNEGLEAAYMFTMWLCVPPMAVSLILWVLQPGHERYVWRGRSFKRVLLGFVVGVVLMQGMLFDASGKWFLLQLLLGFGVPIAYLALGGWSWAHVQVLADKLEEGEQ